MANFGNIKSVSSLNLPSFSNVTKCVANTQVVSNTQPPSFQSYTQSFPRNGACNAFASGNFRMVSHLNWDCSSMFFIFYIYFFSPDRSIIIVDQEVDLLEVVAIARVVHLHVTDRATCTIAKIAIADLETALAMSQSLLQKLNVSTKNTWTHTLKYANYKFITGLFLF